MAAFTRHEFKLNDKPVSYLDAGPRDGPLIVLVHGWPEFAEIWTPQIEAFAAVGFRVVAPDLPGSGQSFISDDKRDYSLERINATFLALLAHLQRDKAVWIGHDWGATLVWSFVAHYPQNTHGAVTMCVPYRTLELGIADGLVKYCDRSIYPEDQFPNAQWDYQVFYLGEDTWKIAMDEMAVDVPSFFTLLYRKGDPAGKGKPAFTAFVTKNGGWFPGGRPPAGIPLDTDVLDEGLFNRLVASYQKTGFAGISSYYLNHDVNQKYTEEKSVDNGVLSVPSLFVEATYDWICEVADSRLAEPQRKYVRNLTEVTIDAGHWVGNEKPEETNAAILKWIATELPDIWPYNKTVPLRKIN